MNASVARPGCLAFFARAPVAQELPRIDPQFVAIVEMKFDGVFANAFRRSRFDGGLEHRQGSRRSFRRIAGLLVVLGSLLIAQGAGAGIPQEGKRVVGLVAVFPRDVEAGAGGQVDFDRLRIRGGGHEFSIAQREG